MNSDQYLDQVRAAVIGLAVGDALGVPVEFHKREYFKSNPVVDMIGFGTHDQPPGTWSDDSSMAFCLAEVLADEYSIHTLGENFKRWLYDNYWTPHGEIFDVGIATRKAINNLNIEISPLESGGFDEYSNGNGSLMRILPLAFHVKNMSISERFQITKEVSAITHAHIRSVIACFYYVEFALKLITNKDKFQVFEDLRNQIPTYLSELKIYSDEIQKFKRLWDNDFPEIEENDIFSSGYVVHTLEASIWCLLTTNNYSEAVLKAVNLGDDTDTTATVTGGLAGILYGINSIPEKWKQSIARYDDIENLAIKLAHKTFN